MNKVIRKEIEFANRKLVLETGELATRANMAVKASFGDTVVLVTAVSGSVQADADFFPLTVEYEEKLYASGTIKTSRFVKRDGKSTDEAIIAKRAIDHAIRPLFPKDYLNEVQIVATVLSLDPVSDPEFLSMIGVSAALQASDIPFYGPVLSARVGIKEGQLVLCPSVDDLEDNSDLDMLVSFVGEDKKLLALEMGANVLPEEKILEAINYARDSVDPIGKLISDFISEINPDSVKKEYESKSIPEEVFEKVCEIEENKIFEALSNGIEGDALKTLKNEIETKVLTSYENTYKKVDMLKSLEKIEKEAIRKLVLENGKRIDGRNIDEIRDLSSKISILPRTHGSALFVRGTTQALTVATLGSPSLEILIQDMYGERSKRFMHYYNFPPFSTGEVGRFGSPKGREIGHGMIAEKALKPMIPSQKEFPYTVILVSEILSSNGSSSMAATCGSTLALMDAGVPLKDMVAGIAMGLIVSDDDFSKYVILTDLCGEEDAGGFMDFKMTGTKDGVTAIQVDMKVKGIPMKIVPEILEKSKNARLKVLESMQKTISEPKDKVSDFAPKMVTLSIDPSKIGLVIGSGGKTIKEIQEKTGAEIFIEEDGSVVISSNDISKAEKAGKIVYGLTADLSVGDIYDGTVTQILDFGALVEILPGRVGLLHVSELANSYVKNVEDFVKIGDEVKVKILALGNDGKISLSKKALENPSSSPKDFVDSDTK